MIDVLNLTLAPPPGVVATQTPIRIVGDPARPQFVAADLAKVLGIQNLRQVVAAFDDDEKGAYVVHTADQSRVLTTVYESGLYRVLACSRKPEARAFQRWLFHDVLPCVRRHGCYPAPLPATVSPAPPVVRDALTDDIDVLFAAVRALRDVRLAQRATDGKLAAVEATVAAVAATAAQAAATAEAAIQQGQNFHGYLTVLGYCRLTKREIPESAASQAGKRATALCKQRGLLVGSQRSERYNKVGSYPVSVLAEVFGDSPPD